VHRGSAREEVHGHGFDLAEYIEVEDEVSVHDVSVHETYEDIPNALN